MYAEVFEYALRANRVHVRLRFRLPGVFLLFFRKLAESRQHPFVHLCKTRIKVGTVRRTSQHGQYLALMLEYAADQAALLHQRGCHLVRLIVEISWRLRPIVYFGYCP